MGYDAGRGFFEDAVRHGVTEEAADVHFVEVDGFCDLGVGGGFVDGEGFCWSVVSPTGDLKYGKIRYPSHNDIQHVGLTSYCAVCSQRMSSSREG